MFTDFALFTEAVPTNNNLTVQMQADACILQIQKIIII